MFWKREAKPIAVPMFGALEKSLYPVVFESYGTIPIVSGLSHRLTIGRLTSATGYTRALSPGKLLSRKILAEEGDRAEDRQLWQQLLNGYPTHYLRFSYQRLSEPVAPPKEIVHVWLCLSIAGFDTNAIARSIGDFLTFIALEQQQPSLLVSTKIYSAESWLFFVFSRYRRFWVEAGVIQEREAMPDVKGYRLMGDG